LIKESQGSGHLGFFFIQKLNPEIKPFCEESVCCPCFASWNNNLLKNQRAEP
jgi:hypothetical protein